MKSIKLYGYATSPYVRKTGCFLYYKGIDFTHVPVNPIKPKATIGHTNGTQVPVLEVDGEWRRESSDHARWLDEPTMLDFAVFPQLVFGYMFGLEENLSAATHPVIKGWLKRVSEHLPKNPTLAADKMQVNSLAEALT